MVLVAVTLEAYAPPTRQALALVEATVLPTTVRPLARPSTRTVPVPLVMVLVTLERPTPMVLALVRTPPRPVLLVVPAVVPVRTELVPTHLPFLRQAPAPRPVAT